MSHDSPRNRSPSAAAAAAASAVVLVLLVPLPAQGCSCLEMEHWGFLGPQFGHLPANATGVLWFKPFDRYRPQPSPSESEVAGQITVEKRNQDRFEPVPSVARSVDGFRGIFVVAPQEGLVIGATYRFTDHDSPHEDGVRKRSSGRYSQVQVTVAADQMPANAELSLETAAAPERPIHVAEGNLCSMPADYLPLAPIAARLPAKAQRWQDRLLFRTLVDGEPWAGAGSSCSVIPSGRSWRQIGQEIIYGTCTDPDVRVPVPLARRGPGGPSRLLAATTHTVQMQAFLPGTDIVLESGTLTVDLTCPGPMEE